MMLPHNTKETESESLEMSEDGGFRAWNIWPPRTFGQQDGRVRRDPGLVAHGPILELQLESCHLSPTPR